jgi:hypothetical protein
MSDNETAEGRDEKRAALDTERKAADSPSDGTLVEQRTADTHETKAARGVDDAEHVKVFVIPPGNKPASDYDHEPNIAATRQYMISQGLRPTGDVRFVGSEPFGPGGKSWALTYAVTAVPAERFDFETEVHVIQDETPDEKADEGEAAPTEDSTRAAIDEYAQRVHGIDTTGAGTKKEALALFPQPSA